MERWVRRIIPLQVACRERNIHRGGVSGDGKEAGARYRKERRQGFDT
jgi:hypothetical protein